MTKSINSYQDLTSLFIRQSLSKIDYFHKLKNEDLTLIRFSLRKEIYLGGTSLFTSDSTCQKAYIVVSGRAMLSFKVRRKRKNYSELVLKTFHRGSVINPLHLLTEQQHCVSCDVIEEL